VTGRDVHRAIDAVWRIESAKVIAGLARIVRDVGLAEDLAQEALVAALEQWPESGVPDNPGAWLTATAKRRGIDRLRRDRVLERKYEALGRGMEIQGGMTQPDVDAALDDHVGDDLLSLMFTTCHPVLSTEARVALTLRLLGGLTTTEIARAFLASDSTVAQRIVRAKRTLAEAKVPFEVPREASLALARPDRPVGPARPPARSGSSALGPRPHPSWTRGARDGVRTGGGPRAG
jgi:RNA polymerase sigma factor (sigma-70 family)